MRNSWSLEHLISEFSNNSLPSMMIAPLAKIMSTSLTLLDNLPFQEVDKKSHLMFVKLRGLLIHLACSKVYLSTLNEKIYIFDGQLEIAIVLESIVNILLVLKRKSLGINKVCHDVWNEFCFDFIFDRIFSICQSAPISIPVYVAFYRFLHEVRIQI